MKDYVKFVTKIGLIEDDDGLKSINAPDGYLNGCYDANSITAKALLQFVKDNPKYHIVTSVDSDDEKYSEIMVNDYAVVNRICFWLASGSKDYCEYTEKRDND